MYLYIDTSKEKTLLSLYNQEACLIGKVSWLSRFNHSEQLLLKIDALLTKNNVSKNSLSGIIANLGPGSYTGLRAGLTTANFLSLSLNIPKRGIKDSDREKIVEVIKKGEDPSRSLLRPLYSRPPHITQPKNHAQF